MTECHELSMPVSVFESIEACTAERRFALADVRSQALHVVGERLAVDPALEDDYDQIVWTVRPDGSLWASPAWLSRRTGRALKKTILINSKIGQAKPVFSC